MNATVINAAGDVHVIDAVSRANETAAAVTLLEAIPVPCAVYCTANHQLRFANQGFRKMFGRGDAIALQHVFEARFAHYPQKGDDDNATKLPQSDAQARRVYDAFEPASNNWFCMQWSDFDWSDGLNHTMVTVSNTSARHAAVRDQVHERDKLLFTSRMMSVGEMASTIAHELNQPLAAIINYLAVSRRLLESPDTVGDALEAVDMAQAQAQHASAVIRHLREFVRAREPQRRAHRVESIIAKVLQLTELDIKQNLVTVTHDCAANLPHALIDDVMIEQVLLNLVRNAIGAMRETHPMHRRILVTVALNLDDDLEVRVTDSGCGVTRDHEGRLFEPLFTTKPDGLGIGLAICRSILEYHTGRLWFERDADGQTVFALTLPTIDIQGDSND
ncbi:MAG: sensor histidine kinase [Gammaproteobacteria bacterium]